MSSKVAPQLDSAESENNKFYLYETVESFHAQFVRFAFAELGISYLSQPLQTGPSHVTDQPWYILLNRTGSVPTLLIKGKQHNSVTDPIRIILYCGTKTETIHKITVEDQFKSDQDYCTKTLLAINMNLIEDAYTPGVVGHFKRVSYMRRIAHMQKLQDTNEDLFDFYDARIKQIKAHHQALKDPAAVKSAIKTAEAALNYFENRLKKNDSNFVVGTSFSLTDIILTTLLAKFQALGVTELFDESSKQLRPALVQYYKLHKARPTFSKAKIPTKSLKFTDALGENCSWIWTIYGQPLSLLSGFGALVWIVLFFYQYGKLPFKVPQIVDDFLDSLSSKKVIPQL